jgi:hypothetical protein
MTVNNYKEGLIHGELDSRGLLLSRSPVSRIALTEIDSILRGRIKKGYIKSAMGQLLDYEEKIFGSSSSHLKRKK